MNIDILKPIGYCEGVKRAIYLVIKVRKDNPDKKVYVFNMLVHNEAVISKLDEIGVITLRIPFSDVLKQLNPGDILIFSAHGHDPKYSDLLKEKGIIVYDTVCPKVNRILTIIKQEIKNKHQIIYLGIKNHQEANAALSLSNDILFYDVKTSDFDYELVKDVSPLVINQTTLNTYSLSSIFNEIKTNIPNARIQNEICPSTRLRQENIISINKNTDMIYIIGDEKSSNTKRLLEISRTYHPNIDSQIISSYNDINIDFIKTKKYLVICSGASTPLFLIEEIINYLKTIK